MVADVVSVRTGRERPAVAYRVLVGWRCRPVGAASGGTVEVPRSESLIHAADGELVLATFRCLPGDPAWRRTNDIADLHVLAFPHRAVGIRVFGRSGLVADPNRVVLYDPNSHYERRLIDPDGDRCTYIGVAPSLLERFRVPLLDGRHGFVTDHVAVDPEMLIRLRVLAREVRDGVTDALTSEEQLVDLALDVLGVAHESDEDRRPGTVRAHRRLVEDARGWVAARATEQWRLDELAADLHTAPAHLHRVFRSHTGTSIHEHRDRLRLAQALDQVLDGAEDLSQVAMTVGYSSHSHFTRRFRRAFGVTPSHVRGGEPVSIVTASG